MLSQISGRNGDEAGKKCFWTHCAGRLQRPKDPTREGCTLCAKFQCVSSIISPFIKSQLKAVPCIFATLQIFKLPDQQYNYHHVNFLRTCWPSIFGLGLDICRWETCILFYSKNPQQSLKKMSKNPIITNNLQVQHDSYTCHSLYDNKILIW